MVRIVGVNGNEEYRSIWSLVFPRRQETHTTKDLRRNLRQFVFLPLYVIMLSSERIADFQALGIDHEKCLWPSARFLERGPA